MFTEEEVVAVNEKEISGSLGETLQEIANLN